MNLTESGGIYDAPNQEIELGRHEVNRLYEGEEIVHQIYYEGEQEVKREITVKSIESYRDHRKLLKEIESLERGRDVNGGEVYDDVMDALIEMITAIGDMNERIINGESPTRVYRDVLYFYNIQKCIDTFDYYDSIRQEYR